MELLYLLFYLVYALYYNEYKDFLNKDKLMKEVLECYKIIVPYATETTSVTQNIIVGN